MLGPQPKLDQIRNLYESKTDSIDKEYIHIITKRNNLQWNKQYTRSNYFAINEQGL